MKISVIDPEHDKYHVIDNLTGLEIPLVQQADDETGEVHIYLYNLADDKIVEKYNYVTKIFECAVFIIKPINGIRIIKDE